MPQPVAPPTDAIIDDADERSVPTGTTPPATTDTDGERGSIPLAIWILAGAGAVAASYPRTRARTTTRATPASASPAAGMYRTVGAVVPRPQPPTSPEENTNNSPAETPGTAAPSGQGGGDQATTPSYEPSDDSSYGGDSGDGSGYSGGGYGGESSGGGGQGQGTSTSPPVTALDNKQDPPPQAFNPGTETETHPGLQILGAAAGIVIALVVGIGQFFNLWFQSLFGDDGHPVPMPKLGDVDVDKLIRDLLTALMQDPAAVERAIRQAIADATPKQREQLRQLWSQITDNLDRIDDPDIREQLRQAIDRYGPVLEDALRDPQQPPRPTTPSDSPDPESPGEPRQPGDTPDSPDSPRQPGDTPEPPPTEAPDQPTPPGDLPDPDTSPDPGPDEPTPPGDTPNPDNSPTAPGNTPPSPPKPDTPQTPDTPDTPETPGEPSTPGEVPDHTPPDWWQPTTPPDPDTPDFRHPPEPDYAPPPTDPADLGRMLADWLSAIIAAITPPPPTEPEGDDGHYTLDQTFERIRDFVEQAADLAAALSGVADDAADDTAQRWGTRVHTTFEGIMKSEVAPHITKWLGPDFALHIEESINLAFGLDRDDDTNEIVWAPRGESGTARPDAIVTQMVDGFEEIVLVIDLKTGNADISRSWLDAVSKALDIGTELIETVRPVVPRPGHTPHPTPVPTTD